MSTPTERRFPSDGWYEDRFALERWAWNAQRTVELARQANERDEITPCGDYRDWLAEWLEGL